MSKKISDFFNIQSKSTKTEENISVAPKIPNSREILKNIKHQFGGKDLILFDKVPVSRNNNCDNEKNECKHCGKKIYSDMKEHMKRVHPTEFNLIYCQFCNLKFLRKSYFDIHMKAKHPDGQVEQFECDFDGKIFKNKKNLLSHMKVHLSLTKCKICDKILKNSCIYSHMNNFHGEGEFHCKICSKTFKSAHYLKYHSKIHNKKFECEICKKMFPNNEILNKHKTFYHEKKRNFECENCGNKFNQKAHLKSHQKTHERNRPKPYKCQNCDYATDDKPSFNRHHNYHERQNRKFAAFKNPVKCSKCSTFCKDKIALKLHLLHVHPKDSFQCDLCARVVKLKGNLIKHMKVHVQKF